MPETPPAADRLTETLKSVFGFEKFHPGQAEILNDILAGRNVVAIIPTGGGKSLLYQLPAVLNKGVTLVISPLISLMKDQVDALQAKGIAATCITSALTPAEKAVRMEGLRQNRWRLVYVAPERMRDPHFMELIKGLTVDLLAVDEAHCISQWGHDFRPDYMHIKDLRRHIGTPVTIALTATATRVVRADIARHLELETWEDHLAGFDRENLFFKVTEVGGRNEKFDWIRAAREQMKGPGIVYAATRKNVELIAATLRMDRVPTLTYHGGMAAKDRTEAQERFMHGDIPLVIATNAFGMGIDKPDIRFVVHYDVPGSIESYYQEVGRAGRDGKPALCHLLFSYADVRIQEFFISESNPDPAVIHAAAGRLRAAFQPGGMVPSLDDVPGITSDMARQSILHLFEQAGIIACLPEGDIFVAGPDRRQALAELIRHSAEKRANDEEKLAQMVAYAYNRGCRRNRILEYFGDVHEHPGCRACDRCLSPVARVTLTGRELDQARTVLTAVHELRGRFGVEKTAQFLRGAGVAWLRTSQWRHAATCGALADLKQDRISDLINELVAVGYCAVRLEDGRYPMLEITAAGAAVMRGEAECQLERTPAAPSPAPRSPKPVKTVKQSAAKSPRRPKAAPSDIVNPDLYEALKAERTAVAAKKRLAPFKVLHDRTLQEMARLKPATLDDLAVIPGFGPVKLKKYGETFLRVISDHTP